ncbi:tyrosine-type recombinase/integrase [Psychrobacillus sp. PGGUH221]|uniref:tyrosine-type recombinase/integrase n=1 Tax=Psychrobacillus sp. PGGUH221 TaxID=3020058 RepID=UPI0035C6A9C6
MSPPKKYWISEKDEISKDVKKVLNEYLLSLKLENKAEATITKYRVQIEKFLVECNVPLVDLTSDIVCTWLNNYSANKKPRTIDFVLSSLSSFFRYCLEEEYMEIQVIKNRWRPKIPPSLPQYLTEQEYARVKLAAEGLSIRDRALILFLFSSGCRKSEVSNIALHDVDMAKRTAKVTGKGNKIRYIHFSEECAIILKEYLRIRTAKSDFLFVNQYGNQLGRQSIYNITTKLGRRVGLLQSMYPHSCRHTFATMMLARGAELEFIKDELGHSDLNTTRVYARIPSEELMIAYQNKMG